MVFHDDDDHVFNHDVVDDDVLIDIDDDVIVMMTSDC